MKDEKNILELEATDMEVYSVTKQNYNDICLQYKSEDKIVRYHMLSGMWNTKQDELAKFYVETIKNEITEGRLKIDGKYKIPIPRNSEKELKEKIYHEIEKEIEKNEENDRVLSKIIEMTKYRFIKSPIIYSVAILMASMLKVPTLAALSLLITSLILPSIATILSKICNEGDKELEKDIKKTLRAEGELITTNLAIGTLAWICLKESFHLMAILGVTIFLIELTAKIAITKRGNAIKYQNKIFQFIKDKQKTENPA